MSIACYSCGNLLSFKENNVSRRETCSSCNADLHCCFACKFYESSAYNQCHELNAERVLQKDKSNFCDYFELGSATLKVKIEDEKEKAMEALKSLFRSN